MRSKCCFHIWFTILAPFIARVLTESFTMYPHVRRNKAYQVPPLSCVKGYPALPTLGSAALLKLLVGVQSLDQAAALQKVQGQQQSHSTPLCRLFAQPAVHHLQPAQM